MLLHDSAALINQLPIAPHISHHFQSLLVKTSVLASLSINSYLQSFLVVESDSAVKVSFYPVAVFVYEHGVTIFVLYQFKPVLIKPMNIPLLILLNTVVVGIVTYHLSTW